MLGSKERMQGPDPLEKSQSYGASQQYWSVYPELSQSYQARIHCRNRRNIVLYHVPIQKHYVLEPDRVSKTCVDPESSVSEGPTLTTLFKLMREGRIQILLEAGHQRTASETPLKWRFAGGTMMARQ